jgi:succinate dehydrogenase / fumarate reductase cytochrome b subunit
MADRPLSPHLFDGMRIHYRWGPHMLVSIVHRVTGQGLSFVGIPVLLWWLGALVTGPEAYGKFVDVADSPIGYIVLIGLSWAFFTHLCSGLRHFVLDVGANYELGSNRRGSIASLVISILLTIGFWAVVILR